MGEELLDFKLIGERIKSARKEKGYTQENISERLGVATVYLSRIETGKAKVSLKRLAEIAQILDKNISEFVTGTKFEEKTYLEKDMSNLLATCSKKKQRLIYNVAKIIANMDVVDKKNKG